ncbi:MAG: PHP domain-containing protein [Deltaproteobacteria bacterium]|jgi:predicted metal-dependent phosphoesterase TrpH|nr:PHP domain-containing protein [Deltaproteobacteria bacterium]
MRIDLHCHSKYSHDNYLEPEELIEQAINVNLDGVCFTEHNSLGASRPVERITIPEGFYIFRGLEISTDRGHLLVYGLKDDSWNIWNRDNYLDVFQVIEIVHGLGGICVPAHPFRGWDSFGEDVLSIEGLDAIETHSGRNSEDENREAMHAARIKNLPSIGGSDCHSKEQVGRAFTEFTYPVHTVHELIEEIRKGNCRGMTL